MLKIKDNVGLKELEKYGFIKAKKGMTEFCSKVKWWYSKNNDEYECLTVFEDRTLYLGSEAWGDSYILNTLYDLIKDGLVEKV